MGDKNAIRAIVFTGILLGSAMLAGLGFLGLLVQVAQTNGDDSSPLQDPESNEELMEYVGQAESKMEYSMDQAGNVKENTPVERENTVQGGFSLPGDQHVQGDIRPPTRSEDDLLSDDGYIGQEDSPEPVEVDLDDTQSLIDKGSDIFSVAEKGTDDLEMPRELESDLYREDPEIPVTENGLHIDEEEIDEVHGEKEQLAEDLESDLGDMAPDMSGDPISENEITSDRWNVTNRTVIDEDLDGNPESIHEIRFVGGWRNSSTIDGSLKYAMGYEYTYLDEDSDGVPEYENRTVLKYGNYSMGGVTMAEAIKYTSVVKKDTDDDGNMDYVKATHLTYAYKLNLIGTVRTYAKGGVLTMNDIDSDGTFDSKKAEGFVIYTKVSPNNVTLNEAIKLVSVEVDGEDWTWEQLAFHRRNDTAGNTILEEGYVFSAMENGQGASIVLIAAKNNTRRGLLQYVVINATRTTIDGTTVNHVVGFAAENRTVGNRKISSVLALDWKAENGPSQRKITASAAAARNSSRDGGRRESFVLVSCERTFTSATLTYGKNTAIIGVNSSVGVSMNSTMGFSEGIYQDPDGDGNPELIKRSTAVARSEDLNSDGIPEKEAYRMHSLEITDGDSDSNPESVHNFTLRGWKEDSNGDGFPEVERGLLKNITSYDNNSNGNAEIIKENLLGFLKEDDDSDGELDHEKYMVMWKEITDVNDDGTTIKEESGTVTHEN
mgnify:CR=1 FL=1